MQQQLIAETVVPKAMESRIVSTGSTAALEDFAVFVSGQAESISAFVSNFLLPIQTDGLESAPVEASSAEYRIVITGYSGDAFSNMDLYLRRAPFIPNFLRLETAGLTAGLALSAVGLGYGLVVYGPSAIMSFSAPLAAAAIGLGFLLKYGRKLGDDPVKDGERGQFEGKD